MTAKRAAAHPSEAALTALVNHELPPDETTWTHVVGCSACEERVEELAAIRDGLRAVGDSSQAPPRNIAQDAMRRLRARGAAVAGVNEFFSIWRSFMRGINAFFGGGGGDSAAEESDAPYTGKESRNG